MFDFTTTTFIHNADMIEANPGTNNHSGSGNSGTSNMLRLENKIFKAEDVVAIYRNPYVEKANAKLYVDVEGLRTKALSTADFSSAKRFKLDFYLRRSGDNNSFYSNDFVFKGKDFHYEWTDKQNTADKVAKMINKIIRLYGDVYLKVGTELTTEDGVTKTYLVFENDNYGVFTEAQLKIYVPQEGDCCTYREGGWEVVSALGGSITSCEDGEDCNKVVYPELGTDPEYAEATYTNKTASLPDVTFGSLLIAHQGVNGFGTYEQILKDLRLPTMENFRWTSLNESEMPIPGNKYVQYTFHQISCRGVLGGAAVGEVTHSKTTHVFFVPTCGCGENGDLDSAMQAAITEAGMKKLLVDMGDTTKVTLDPTHNPKDFENIEYDPSVKADTTTAGEHTTPEPTEPAAPGGGGD